jgi:hypothetical protein
MGQVFQFPTGVLSQTDQDIEDRRLTRERIATVAYEEAQRICSDPRTRGHFRDPAEFEASVSGVAKCLLERTLAIVAAESESRTQHAIRGEVCLPSESFDARNRRFVPPSRERKTR